MKRIVSTLIGLSLGMVLSFGLPTPLAAKKKDKMEKTEKMAGEMRVSGTVHMINKDTSTITVQKGTTQRQVVYGADTKYTYRNKPASLDDVKEGRRVIVLGKADGAKIMATRIDVREGK